MDFAEAVSGLADPMSWLLYGPPAALSHLASPDSTAGAMQGPRGTVIGLNIFPIVAPNELVL